MKTLTALIEELSNQIKLSDKAWLGLGIYIAYKSKFRRREFERYNLNYDDVVSELTKVGLIRKGKLNQAEGRKVFAMKFGDQIPSQVHQYIKHLNLD